MESLEQRLLLSSVRGRVFNDANNDGLQNETETSVDGLPISLWDAGSDQQVQSADDRLVERTASDSSGTYSFDVSAAGTYYLQFGDQVGAFSFSSIIPVDQSQNTNSANELNGLTSAFTLTGDTDVVNRNAGVRFVEDSSELRSALNDAFNFEQLPAGYLTNFYGHGEKWFIGSLGADTRGYSLLPDGSLYNWDGTVGSAGGYFIAQLSPEVYETPALLHDAPSRREADSTEVSVYRLDRQHHFVLTGNYHESYADLGVKWLAGDTNSFGLIWYFVTSSGDVWEWDGQGGQATGNRLAILTSAYFDDPVLLANPLRPGQTNLASQVKDGFSLSRSVEAPFTGDVSGNIWFEGAWNEFGNNYYFLNSSGQLFAWDGSQSATGSEVASVPAEVHADPSLLVEALYPSTQTTAQGLAYDLFDSLNLETAGYYFQNWGGANERWLKGTTNLHGNDWYYILPTGEFFAWDQQRSATGTKLANLSPIQYAHPFVLHASLPPLQEPNQTPVAESRSLSAVVGGTNQPLSLVAPTDPDGDTLTISVTELPLLGTIRQSDGTPITLNDQLTINQLTSLLYDSPTNWDGTDDPGEFSYDVTDGNAIASGRVDVSLVAQNAPVADSRPLSAVVGATGQPLLLVAPTDPDGDLLTISVTGLPALGTIRHANGVLVSVDDQLDAGQLTSLLFDSPTEWDGTEDPGELVYEVTDGFATTEGRVDISLAVRNAPIADSRTLSAIVGVAAQSLSLSAPTDPDGDLLTVTVTELPLLGAVKLSDGTLVNVDDQLTSDQLVSLVYDSPAEFNGADNPGDFVYEVSDGEATVEGRVNIVLRTQSPPIVDSRSLTAIVGAVGQPLSLIAPTDPDGDTLVITVQELPALGTVRHPDNLTVEITQQLSSDQLVTLIYDSPSEFNGSSDPGSFTYTVSDGIDTVEGRVDFALTFPQRPPIVDSRTFEALEGATEQEISLLAPTDPDGDSLTITVKRLPALGVVRLANGSPVRVDDLLAANELTSLTYDSPAQYNGTDAAGEFVYEVADVSSVVEGQVDILLNPADGNLLTLREGDNFLTEQTVEVELGADTGSRLIEIDIDPLFDTTDHETSLADTFLISLVETEQHDTTLLDRGTSGTALFTLSEAGSDFVPGLVQFDGTRITIDASSVVGVTSGLLKFQMVNVDADSRSRVYVNAINSRLVEDTTPREALVPNRLLRQPGPDQDFSDWDFTSDVTVTTTNQRVTSSDGHLSFDSTLTSTSLGYGKNLAIAFAGLPDGVSLATPSGTDGNGNPVISFAEAISSGGLAAGTSSHAIQINLLNPNELQFDLSIEVIAGPANNAPSLEPIPDLNVMPGNTLRVPLQGTDADEDTLRYHIESDEQLPRWQLSGNGVLSFFPSPEDIGQYTFDAVVTDGSIESRQTVNLAVIADTIQTSRVSGFVLNTESQPIPGITVELNGSSVTTESDGSFLIEAHELDRESPLRIHGEEFVGDKEYPFVAERLKLLFEYDVYESVNNVVVRPIYLPALDVANEQQIDPNADTTVDTAAIPGASVFVQQGTLRDQQGDLFDGMMSITEVPVDLTPAALPLNHNPTLVVTIQPGEMVFETPAPLSLPNTAGYEPGTELALWSINPATGLFDNVGLGVVSADATVIDTVSGGIRNSSWHYFERQIDAEDNKLNPLDGCACDEKTVNANSEVVLHSGALLEEHRLVTYSSVGQTRGFSLQYDSLRADPRPIMHVSYENVRFSNGAIHAGSFTISGTHGGGFERAIPGHDATIDGLTDHEHFWRLPALGSDITVAVQGNAHELPTGEFSFNALTGFVRRGSDGKFTGGRTETNLPFLNVNLRGSEVGVGWSIAGLPRIYEQSEGTAILVDGNSELVFRAPADAETGVVLQLGEMNVPAGDFSTLTRTESGYIRTLRDGTTYTFARVTAAGQSSTMFSYENLVQLASMVDRNGNQTTYEYDDRNRIQAVTDPVGLVTTFSYENEMLRSITDPTGRTTELIHDQDGNLKSISDPDGSVRTFEYDSSARMTGEVDKRGESEKTFYDFSGRVSHVIRKDQSRMNFNAPQSHGLFPPESTARLEGIPIAEKSKPAIAETVNARGNVISTELNRLGQELSETDSLGIIRTIQRDDRNLPIAITNGRGQLTNFTYDASGNATSHVDEVISGVANFSQWIAPGGGDWSDGANWSTGEVPARNASVIINTTLPDAVIKVSSQVNVSSLISSASLEIDDSFFSIRSFSTIDGNVSLVNSGRLSIFGDTASLTVTGDFNLGDGRLSLGTNANLSVTGVSNLNTGTLSSSSDAKGVFSNVASMDSTEVIASGGTLEFLGLQNLKNTHFDISGGGKVYLPDSDSYEITDSRVGTIVDGLGSLLDLNAVTSITAEFSSAFPFTARHRLTARNRGHIDLSGVVELQGPNAKSGVVQFFAESRGSLDLGKLETSAGSVNFNASGSQSLISIPELAEFSGTATNFATGAELLSGIGVVDSGRIEMPKLTKLQNAHLNVANSNAIDVSQIESLTNSLLSVTSEQPDFSGLTDVSRTRIRAYGGAVVTIRTDSVVADFPGGNEWLLAEGENTRLDLSSAQMISGDFSTLGSGQNVFIARDKAHLDLSGVSSIVGPSNTTESLRLRTESGATLDLSGLTNSTGAIQYFVQDSGSLLHLDQLQTASRSRFDVITGGNIALPALVVAESVAFGGDGNGQITGPNDDVLVLSGASQVDGSSIEIAMDRLTVTEGSSTSLEGSLTANLTNEGTVGVGVSAARVAELAGDFDQLATGTLTFGIARTFVETEYSRLEVANNASFGGSLAINLIDGFTPSDSDEFVVVTYADHSGRFDNIEAPIFGENKTFNIEYRENEAVLVVVESFSGSESVQSAFTAFSSSNFDSPTPETFEEPQLEIRTQSAALALVTTENQPVRAPTRIYEDEFGQLTESTDELGRKTIFDIDPDNGNVRKDTRFSDSGNLTTTYTYTSRGLVNTVQDPLGRLTDYDYDPFGRLTTVTFAVGTVDEAAQSFRYDAAGNVIEFVDENGNRTSYRYDALNRVERITEPDPDGDGPLPSPVSIFRYDKAGNVLSLTDAENSRTSNLYDSMGRLIRATDSIGNATRFRYDNSGNLVATTDPRGEVTRNEYDARNRLVKTTDPNGGITRFAYDPDGNMISLVDPVGNSTRFVYDSRDRLQLEVDPFGNTTQYDYDAVDNLIRKTDRNGRKTEFNYDDLDRLFQEDWLDEGGALANQIDYSYDDVGNLLNVSDNFSELTFTYDKRDRAKTVDNAGTPDAPQVLIEYGYDGVGNVTSVTDTIGGGASTTTGYKYDALNRTTQITQSGVDVSEKRVDFAYNQIGQYESIVRYSDLAGTQLVVSTDYDYDSINRLTDSVHTNSADDVLAFYSYEYDSASRITEIEDIDGVSNYAYDDRNQLTGANRADDDVRGDESYAYDANGNRQSSHLHGTDYQTGDANRLLSDGTSSYEYDDEGNMILRTAADGSTRRFDYDHRNRLVQVTDRDAIGSQIQHVEYAYDAIDRRIQKTVTDESNLVASVQFVYDREDVLFDFTVSDTIRYLHGPDIDQVLAHQTSNDSVWYLTDHLGSTRAIADFDGLVTQRFAFDSYGQLINGDELATRFLFTGREYEIELRLNYLRARYYDVASGFFISQDSARLISTLKNKYTYAVNNPTKYTDSFGREAESRIDVKAPRGAAGIFDPISRASGTTVSGVNELLNFLGATDGSTLDLIGHARAGSQNLGTDSIDSHFVSSNPELFASIGAALGPGCRINLFGCQVGRGEAGQNLLKNIAAATGCTVSGSPYNQTPSSTNSDRFRGGATSCNPSGTCDVAATRYLHGLSDFLGNSVRTLISKAFGWFN